MCESVCVEYGVCMLSMRVYVFVSMCNVSVRVLVFVLSYQLKLIKIRAKLTILNHCAVPFLSRANLYWYCYYSTYVCNLL